MNKIKLHNLIGRFRREHDGKIPFSRIEEAWLHREAQAVKYNIAPEEIMIYRCRLCKKLHIGGITKALAKKAGTTKGGK